jgi:ribosomal protein S18 acetylase RimI-like enzyme
MRQNIAKIRPAKPSDACAIAQIHEDAWRTTYQGIIPHLYLEKMIARRGSTWWNSAIRRSKTVVYVFTFDGEVQGYVSFGAARNQRRANLGEIYELYLAPTYQGLGFGKELFLSAYNALKRDGRRSLLVWALAENEIACGFYNRLGGRRSGTSPERYGDTTLHRIAFVWEPVGRHAR